MFGETRGSNMASERHISSYCNPAADGVHRTPDDDGQSKLIMVVAATKQWPTTTVNAGQRRSGKTDGGDSDKQRPTPDENKWLSSVRGITSLQRPPKMLTFSRHTVGNIRMLSISVKLLPADFFCCCSSEHGNLQTRTRFVREMRVGVRYACPKRNPGR